MDNDRQRKRKETETIVIMIENIVRTHQQDLLTILNMVRTMMESSNIGSDVRAALTYSLTAKIPAQVRHMDRLFGLTDRDCISNLRVDRNAFGRLCRILRDRCGLVHERRVRSPFNFSNFPAIATPAKDDTCVVYGMNAYEREVIIFQKLNTHTRLTALIYEFTLSICRHCIYIRSTRGRPWNWDVMCVHFHEFIWREDGAKVRNVAAIFVW